MNEIDRRLESADWNEMMAGRILSERKKRNIRKIAYSSGAALLIMLSVLLFSGVSADRVPVIADLLNGNETEISLLIDGDYLSLFEEQD